MFAPSPYHAAFASLALLGLYVVSIRYLSALRHIPGPFWDSLTRFPALWISWTGTSPKRHIEYHQKYGSLVRVGPNHVLVADASAIPAIYGIQRMFTKSDFYTLFSTRTPNGFVPTIFSLQDEAVHRTMRRNMAGAYTLKSLLEFEPSINTHVRALEAKMDRYQGQSLNLGNWLHWFAFDVIMAIVFSSDMGFIDNEKDVNGIIAAIRGRNDYNASVGQMPWLHWWVLLGSSVGYRIAGCIPAVARWNTAQKVGFFVIDLLQRRKTEDGMHSRPKDMTAQFKSDNMSDNEMVGAGLANVFAGSDTTAIALRSIIYYLCKNPRCVNRLRSEIDEAELSDIVTYQEASKLRYFQACVKETLRIHPVAGQSLERVVPAGGLTLGSSYLPQGTIVGMNPWAIGRDKSVYGQDVEDFRPERWLSADEETLKKMERAILTVSENQLNTTSLSLTDFTSF